MILADTSLWIDHIREPVPGFGEALRAGDIVTHDMVIGELMCVRFKNRESFLRKLRALKKIRQADHETACALIENFNLMGTGLGFIDIHLLAACRISGCSLWTHDKKLQEIYKSLGN